MVLKLWTNTDQHDAKKGIRIIVANFPLQASNDGDVAEPWMSGSQTFCSAFAFRLLHSLLHHDWFLVYMHLLDLQNDL